jgi:hypothetical protein
MLGEGRGERSKSHFPGLALQIGLTTLAVMVWQLRESGSRLMRRQIVPALAPSLRPTQEEIEAVLWEIKQGTLTDRQEAGCG